MDVHTSASPPLLAQPNVSAAARGNTAPAKKRAAVSRPSAAANNLLAALPRNEYLRLLGSLEQVALTYGEVLYAPGESITHVYFPNDSIVSLLTLVDQHHALEVGLVGREGMVGIPVALEIGTSPVRALVQGTGTAMRMRAAPFVKELRH